MVRAVTACLPACLSVCHSSVLTVMMASNHGFLLARNSVCSCSETQQIMQDGPIIRTVFFGVDNFGTVGGRKACAVSKVS